MRNIVTPIALLLCAYPIFGQNQCNPISEVNFPGGRVVMSYDGNVHDDDDIVALPLAAGLWWAAGLQDKVVQIEYNNHICDINTNENDDVGAGSGDDSQNMRISAAGAISRFGYNSNIFYDYETQGNASTNKMANEIEKSTASNPLWIIAAGPMETVWRALDEAKSGFDHVTIISHSQWNEEHGHCGNDHTWSDLKSAYQNRGVYFVGHCKASSGCNGPGNLPDQNSKFSGPISDWTWLKNSAQSYNRWIFDRNPFDDKFDPSDAGMSYFLITGGPFNGGVKKGTSSDAKKLMENPCSENQGGSNNNAPSITINSPSNNQTFQVGDDVTVNLSASDSDGNITSHEIFVNGSLKDADEGNYSPYQINNIEAGNYEIMARVIDNDGASSSKAINISVSNNGGTNTSPSLTIDSPSNNQNFEVGDNVAINLTASDSNGNIVKHEIFVNGSLEDADGSNYSPYLMNNVEAGDYEIRVKVTDNDGASTTKTVYIYVDNGGDTGRPTGAIEFLSPQNNEIFEEGDDISVDFITIDIDNIATQQVYVNEELVDTDGSNFTAYTLNNASAGNYDIRVVLSDNKGKEWSESIAVSVETDGSDGGPDQGNDSPELYIISPVNNQIFENGDDVVVNIQATDSDGSVNTHKIYVDGNLEDTDPSNFTPYVIEKLTNGSHNVKAEVTDNDGSTTTEIIAIFAVSNDEKDSFTFASPNDNQNYGIGSNITVDLNTSKLSGVDSHKIYVNNILVDTDDSNWTPHQIINIAPGSYTIRAEVTHNNGLSIQELTISVTPGS